MDDWGVALGSSEKLDLVEKAEIVASLFEGYKRQEQAYGYIRAYRNLVEQLDGGLSALEQYLAFDVVAEIKKSEFSKLAQVTREEFEADYAKQLEEFTCPVTNIKF